MNSKRWNSIYSDIDITRRMNSGLTKIQQNFCWFRMRVKIK